MMRCIVLDNHPNELESLAKSIHQIPFLQLIDSCSNTTEAYEILNREHIDLIFLETQLPELNGIDFIKSLSYNPLVIFVTKHNHHAVEAFRIAAVDYLIKPYTFDELYHAAKRAEERYLMYKNTKPTHQVEQNLDYIFVKSEYKIIRIRLSDILYIESMSEYVRIFLDNEQKPILSLLSIAKIEAALPPRYFLRVHRSFIVNMSKVEEVSRMRIIFGKELHIPVGDHYKEAFTQFINCYYVGKE